MIPKLKSEGYTRDGVRLYPMDGGGQQQSPVTQQTQISDIPGWARGYAKDVLARGQALTDINQNPYQAYGGNRVAGLSDLQQQAIKTVSSPEAFGQSVQGFMSPYMQNVVDVQKRAAREQGGIQANTLAAKAAQAGAFGGSGAALQQAAQGRDLSRQLDEIQKMGSQAAYQQGVQQANTALGQQVQLGGLQQQQEQRGLDIGYQNFLDQKNYPYQNLSYMSNLIRGTPMGMSTSSQVYQGAPSALQTMGALGMGAYGLKQLGVFGGAKEGGLMQSYADGGAVGYDEGGMTIMQKFNDPEAMMPDMSKLNTEQLRAIVEAPATPAEREAAQRELAMRASEQQGLASAYNQIPQEARDGMVRAAGGGIIAFAAPNAANNYSLVSSEDDDGPEAGQQVLPTRIADPALQAQLNRRGLSIADYLSQPSGYKAPTAADRLAYMKQYTKEVQEAAGESPYGSMKKYIQEQRDALNKEREEAKGLAALQAIPAILQPGGTIRGLGAAASSIGASMAEANKAQRVAKNQFAQMEFNLTDAERKERMGLHKDARAAYDEGEKNKLAGIKADREAKAAAGNVVAKLAQANRVTGAAGARQPSPKEFEVLPAKYLREIQELYPELSPARQEALASQRYQERKNAGLAGVTTRVEATAEEKARERAAKRAYSDSGVLTAIRKKDPVAEAARRREILAEEMNQPPEGGSAGGGGDGTVGRSNW